VVGTAPQIRIAVPVMGVLLQQEAKGTSIPDSVGNAS
jgi:hypothetical protein